jgi:hypothetical protein
MQALKRNKANARSDNPKLEWFNPARPFTPRHFYAKEKIDVTPQSTPANITGRLRRLRIGTQAIASIAFPDTVFFE